MAEHLKRRILTHLADHRYVPCQIRHLARDLQVPNDQFATFRKSVEQLIEEGQVILGSADVIALPPPGPEMVGSFRLTRGGFGFVIPESATEHGDLFVPAPYTGGALTGDLVRAKVQLRGRAGHAKRSRYVGQVVQILQRADRHFVGALQQRGSTWIVKVDGHLLHEPVLIGDAAASQARPGDKVVIELIRYPQGDGPVEGVITEVLGRAGQADVENRAVMRAFGLPEAFGSDVIQEARGQADQFDPNVLPDDREDWRKSHVLTIDPPDARDFDDAISIRRMAMSKGPAAFELAVHVADVAHFVRPDAALDREAEQRGNSVYLPRNVVPMLPELLSNGVCSLQEQAARYCKSIIIQFDTRGKPCGQRFRRTMIRSNKRLTYREAQMLIDGQIDEAKTHARAEPLYSDELIEQLRLMDELARLIRQRRLDEGMIELDLPKVELVFDDDDRVVDAQKQDDAFTHKIIEMFMVEANEATARLFDSLDVPMVRRVHPDPPSHDLKQLRQFARVAGYNIPANPTRSELQGLLEAVRGRPAQHAVHLAVLKTLSRAEYAPLLIGHFALASEHYTHCTSPIRRYADLIVHRGLDVYLDLTANGQAAVPNQRRLGRQMRSDPRLPDADALTTSSRHCSTTERNAEAAEYELRDFLLLQLLEHHTGEDFQGTVTGVTGDGIFVQLDRYLVDGFIRVAELPGTGRGRPEPWRLNRITGALVAERSGRTITIGDRFTVRVARVQPAARQLDLVITDGGPAGPPGRRKQPKGAATSHRQAMRLKQVRQHDRPRQ